MKGRFPLIVFALLLGLSSWFTSCNDDGFTIGTEFLQSNIYTELIDSVSIKLSTIKPDSLKTSGQNLALIGSLVQKGLGTTAAQSYVSFTNSEVVAIDEKEVYDSLTLILTYSGYSYGDTLKPFHASIHRLTSPIHYKTATGEKDTTYYNTTQTPYESTPLASFGVMPTPSTKGTIEVRLPDALGKELWTYITDKTELYIFLQKFKGLALVPSVSNTAMLGFSVNDSSSLCLKLYSHITTETVTEKERKLGISSTSYQYNGILGVPEFQALNTMSATKLWVDESETKGCAFIQGGTGYSARVDFPYLQHLKELSGNGRIIKALLLLYPDMDYQTTKQLPTTINVVTINKINETGSYLTDSYGSTQTGYLQADPMNNESTYYTFDVTSYINARMADEILLPDQGLNINIPSDDIATTNNSLVLGGSGNKKYKSKLNIYYYYYDKK